MAKRSKKQEGEEPKPLTIYTIELSEDQMDKLESISDRRLYGFHEVKYARFAFKSEQEKVNVVGYSSGKLVVQGKGTEDFVQNVLEAEVTGEPQLGYEEYHHPEWFKPHAGLDEAGKGDLFGPLVAACVIADGEMVRGWRKIGVRDSKGITDSSVLQLEREIKRTKGVVVKISYCGMPRYNALMRKPRANLNRLLAWLHARCLGDALKKRGVEWGMLDQFSRQPLVQQYFNHDSFVLKMQPRAESDPVVAAASICARGEFIRQIRSLSKRCGMQLRKGAGPSVKEQARELVEKIGAEAFGKFAKLHFKTAYEVLGLPVPKRPERKRWKK